MIKHKRILIPILCVFVLLTAVSFVTMAASSAGFDLGWWTLDGGGGNASGGSYSLNGTVGQPEAGAALSGGGYSLSGGFWAYASSGGAVYLPMVLR